jgi:hypothetical protein
VYDHAVWSKSAASALGAERIRRARHGAAHELNLVEPRRAP